MPTPIVPCTSMRGYSIVRDDTRAVQQPLTASAAASAMASPLGHLEREGQRWRRIRLARPLGPPPRPAAGGQLGARLLAIADAVVGAERDLLAVRQQDLLAALHHVL